MFEKKCKSLGCENYIEWSFGFGPCYSCKLVGQSDRIREIPIDCPFKEEFKDQIIV